MPNNPQNKFNHAFYHRNCIKPNKQTGNATDNRSANFSQHAMRFENHSAKDSTGSG